MTNTWYLFTFPYIIPILFAAAYQQRIRAQALPTTRGRIIDRSVQALPATAAGNYYEPRLSYTYSVSGREYTGTHLNLNWASYDRAIAERMLKSVGNKVTVRYDPQDPARSVLCPESLTAQRAWLAVAAALAIFAVGMGMMLALRAPPPVPRHAHPAVQCPP